MSDLRPFSAKSTSSSRAARSLTAVLLATLAAVGSVVALAPAGTARSSEPDQCKALVLDPGHHVDLAKVTRAATKVQDQAADIRVRVYDSVPDGNLDAYVRGLTHRCGTWQDAAGGVKNNLVVLAVDIGDRRTGLYYGDTYRSILDKKWTGIQADAMNPRFEAGDYTGGLVAGLAQISTYVALATSRRAGTRATAMRAGTRGQGSR